MYTKNEIFFAPQVIPSLKSVRGPKWRQLVEQVLTRDEHHEESLAFVLLMIRLNGCMPCETDSYRAMRGCHACAQQTLRRYKGDDDELIALYHKALADVKEFSRQNLKFHIAS